VPAPVGRIDAEVIGERREVALPRTRVRAARVEEDHRLARAVDVVPRVHVTEAYLHALSDSRKPHESSCAAMLQQIYAVVAVILSLAMCVAVIYFLITDRGDREEEEAAREYFDAHGHWPDEA
jgi:hypothetical protein